MLFLFSPICSFGLTNPDLQYYKSDFGDTSQSRPLGEWTSYGSGKKAQDVCVGDTPNILSDFFPQGHPYVSIDFEDIGIVYCSNSTTIEGGAADEWLISPAIDITGAPENLILAYDVVAFGSDNEPKYEVLISTTGNRPEDFTQKPIYSGKTANSVDKPLCKREYKAFQCGNSQKVYIAFVNKSRNAQILGFKDIAVAEYELDVTNDTPGFLMQESDVSVSLKMGIQTPIKCEGYTALLSYNGVEQEITTQRQIGTNYVNADITFKPIHITYGESISYTVAITPNYEGATTSEFNFDMACTEGYPSVCVEEEGTGTWCGWCIRGIAGLNQFADEYGDRFIGIAVHTNNDPMKVDEYLNPFLAQSGIAGFPGAFFNRKITGDPYNREAVETLLRTPVGYSVRVTEARFDEEGSNRVTLTYAPKLAFTTKSANISAAVVVTEDNVSGTGSSWHQINNYSGYSKTAITESFGEEAWPYFQKFCESGPVILDQAMKYDHVAMGIFHSYYGGGEGGSLPSEWNAGEEQQFTLSFEMPMQQSASGPGVQDWRNTHLVVLIIDNATGNILTAAKIGADRYVTTGIEQTSSDDFPVIQAFDERISIKTEGKAKVCIYDIAGKCIHSSEFYDNAAVYAGGHHGPVIIYVSKGHKTYTKKLNI